MKAPDASRDNKYILEVKLNGEILKRSYITHEEIVSGGTLEFTMGPERNEELFQ
jgi:putative alpha-1,2-mannosidase